MKKDLLLIIDMQNVYAMGGQWCCPNTEDAAQRVKTMIDSERIKNKAEIVFTRFLASKNPVGVWKILASHILKR